jgi:proteic killer suppression protein
VLHVIKTFRHKGLRRYFETGEPKEIPSEMRNRIRIRLNVLDRAREIRDLDLPGFDFHALRGDRKHEFALRVSGNYRLTFRFESGDVLDLNLEDYH